MSAKSLPLHAPARAKMCDGLNLPADAVKVTISHVTTPWSQETASARPPPSTWGIVAREIELALVLVRQGMKFVAAGRLGPDH